MSLFQVISALIAIVALSAYANYRLVRLPEATGITAVALLVSLATIALGAADPAVEHWVRQVVAQIDFSALVFHGLLGLLLFAGSLHLNVSSLAQSRWAILVLATVGVVLSTALFGGAVFYGARLVGAPLDFIDCLVFGALVSPTDPIAALGLLGQAKVGRSLLNTITGEALLNDGTGVVVFSVLAAIASGAQSPAPANVAMLLGREVFGGIGFGLAVGYGASLLLGSVESSAVEILTTLAMATAGYAAAEALGVSAPLAVVVMGLVIGNRDHGHEMSSRSRERLFTFWDLTDNLLNLLLFGLIGLELTALAGEARRSLGLALIAIPIALAVRFVSVAAPIAVLRRFERFEPACVRLLTWAGLRGALSVALALSLPESRARAPIVTATYAIALFSTLVQATTFEPLARRWTQPLRPRTG